MPPPRVPRGRGRGKGAAPSTRESEGQREQLSTFSSAVTPTTLNEARSSSIAELVQEDASQPQSSPNNSPASVPAETLAPTPAQAPVQKPDQMSAPRGRGSAMKFRPKAVRRSLAERERAEKEEHERREREMRAVERGRGRGGRGSRGGRGGRGDAAMGIESLNRQFSSADVARGPFGAAPTVIGKGQGIFATGGGPRRDGIISHSVSRNFAGSTSNVKQEHSSLPHLIDVGSSKNLSHMNQMRIKFGFSEPVYPEDQEDGNKAVPKVNVELINLISDDEGSDERDSNRNKGKGKVVSRGLRPVRMQREPHKERVTVVSTEPTQPQEPPVSLPSSSAQSLAAEPDADDLFVSEVANDDVNRMAQRNFVRQGRISSGMGQDDAVGIKYDPGGGAYPPRSKMIDVDNSGLDLPASFSCVNDSVPNRKSKASTKQFSEVGLSELVLKQKDMLKMSTKDERKKSPRVFHSPEAKAEYMRNLEDARVLLQELGGQQGALTSEDTDGKLPDRNKEGRVYLFQVPPTIPLLVNPVKNRDNVDNDVEMVGTGAFSSVAAAADMMDLTKPDEEEVILKFEPGQEPSDIEPPFSLEEGYIGRLIVRASGRVEMDWGDNVGEREGEYSDDENDEDDDDSEEGEDGGEEVDEDESDGSALLDCGDEGVELLVRRGIPVHFLQTAVILDGDGTDGVATDVDMTGIGGGHTGSLGKPAGTGMGKIMGKFVTTPDFNNVL